MQYKAILKPIKFLISGGTAALVEYLIFLSLSAIGTNLVASNSISFTSGLVVSYVFNRLWVFSSKSNIKKQFASYVSLALMNFVISNILIWIFVNNLLIMSPYAKLMTMVMIAAWNYILFSKIIFKDKN